MARTALSKPRLSSRGLTHSLSFDGVADRAASALNAGLSGAAACSLAGWIKAQGRVSSGGAGYIAAGAFTSLGAGVGPALLVVGNGPGNLLQAPFINENGAYIVPTETWVHIAATYAGGVGGERKVYINGSLVLTGTATGAATNGAIQIGGVFVNSLGSYLYTKTKYGPFAVYSDVLAQTEIENIYANQEYPADNAVGIYKLAEGSGTTIADTSGNGRDLTVGAGAPVWSSSDLPVISKTALSQAREALASARTLIS